MKSADFFKEESMLSNYILGFSLKEKSSFFIYAQDRDEADEIAAKILEMIMEVSRNLYYQESSLNDKEVADYVQGHFVHSNRDIPMAWLKDEDSPFWNMIYVVTSKYEQRMSEFTQ